MTRDAWAERRELLEYIFKEHARRGGRVVTPPQTHLYDSRILDQVNVTALVKQLQTGGPVELARLMLPPSSGGRPPDNPFGPTRSGSVSQIQGGGGNPGPNPFGPPSANGSLHLGPQASLDNPFGPGASSSVGGGGAPNPFASNGGSKTLTAAAGSAGGGAGGGEPPVITMSKAPKVVYGGGPSASTTSPPRGPSDAVQRPTDQEKEGEGDAATGVRPPRLDLPQLETGQTDDQLRDLAYLVFAACATGTGLPQHTELLKVMRQQLLIDETRAADVVRVLRHIQPGGQPQLIDHPHPVLSTHAPGTWRPSQRASLELLLRLISVVRPSDFEASTPARAFKGFLRWKDVTVAVLERQIAAAVEASWAGDRAQLRKLLARMHGAARRADVRGEGDFEEEEYGEATRALAETAGQLAAGCATGLRFPWAVRVRLCEILVNALFDTIDEGAYIDEAALVQQFLDTVLFPALGLSASAALAVNAWVHFSMYVATGCKEQRLMKQLKQQISRLAAAAAEAANRGSDPLGLGLEVATAAAPPPPSDELSRDGALAAQVANHLVTFLYRKLCDYHVAFPKGDNMAPMLDVFVFACKSRGDGPDRLAELLVEAVASSTATQFQQQMRARLDSAGSNETRLLEMASIVHDIHDADVASYCAAMAPHLPTALGVACVRLHALYGQYLTPWLNTAKSITPPVLDVFRTANVLEQRLSAPTAKATAEGPHPTAVSEVLASFKRWDLAGPLKVAMMQWVSTQVTNMTTWTARALQAENWKPMGAGPDASHTSSAVEVSRMMTEALDALYGMDVPVPPEVPLELLEGIDSIMRKYATYINDKLGDDQRRLVPKEPTLTRYKKDLVVKNEQAEKDAGRSTRGTSKKIAFLASVPPVESSPDYTNLSAALTAEVLASAACSLFYLHGRAEALLQTWREKQAQTASMYPTPPAPSSATSSPSKQQPESSASVGGAAGEPLRQARLALMTGMQYACKFLATRVVFWDQRTLWLEFLYRHHVTLPASRIEPLLEALHKALAAVCPTMADPVRNCFAKHLLSASVQAMERVLLDGGPCRWFTPTDVQAIDQDIHKLRSLFHAEGDGLEREVIDGELERVRRLLPLMKLEVGPLMDLLKTARTHGTAQITGDTGALGQAYDETVILRVVAHRPERTGSKQLKTWYKLPKKIK